jgi:hypothetical protein
MDTKARGCYSEGEGRGRNSLEENEDGENIEEENETKKIRMERGERRERVLPYGCQDLGVLST